MTRRRLASMVLAAAGLLVYLWPALRAPVVLWSDSTIDLDWARQGVGILSVATPPPSPHPAKPGWLLFLRMGLALGPAGGSERRIVLMQSILVWLSIGFTALRIGRRIGSLGAMALYATLILFLRLRDGASAVMSEALAAALLLPIVALLIVPPERPRQFLLGIAIAVLFLVRPNVGAAALVLAIASLLVARTPRPCLALLLGFAALWVPVWIAAAPKDDRLRALATRADYGWLREAEAERARPALRGVGADQRRQLAWRIFHGPLATEFYDARWSPFYRSLTTASRLLSPFLILAAVAILLAAPWRGPGLQAKWLGLALLGMLLGQSMLLTAIPRFALPLLPALFVFAAAALPELSLASAPLRLASLALFGLFVLGAARQPQILDWEWGMVEKEGVRLTQTIPRGSLPERGPATLHLRIAPGLLPTRAGVDILGPGGECLFSSLTDPGNPAPFLTIPLPERLLEENRRGPVAIDLLSRGDYDATHYLLFPVIPPPWGSEARRDASAELSPASGIGSGALDWWAHAGSP